MTDIPATPAQPAESPHTAGLRKAVRLGAVALVVLTVISAAAWTAIDGTPGLWGALMGAAVGGAFVLTTAIVVIATAHSAPQTTAAVVLGTWLVKLLAAMGVVAALSRFDFYSRPAFAVTVIAALIVVLAGETWAVLKTRAPYVEPDAG
ncbi:hypothetical protein G6027_06725 [Dietzia sp. SLG310A2-38A2]|uniref:hypothetical protein n=1 Tax=Dietzia sp. SLG310A2-38A2 TaxID=1630643 RepID=UPI0015FCDAC4|nr:hypothetical protein [Dietzia sp. SLG310A2-38A2]MBB1030581.1 hypothetical protein [Dietzia sp. SLG310A2-38A2]